LNVPAIGMRLKVAGTPGGRFFFQQLLNGKGIAHGKKRVQEKE
jgi:hypothetical protein